ncbi:MAG: hypothetical protein K8R44_04810 [Sulfurimonas sp.]|jgi:hypothetical protein|nr:hypothetical protein [Sulfurimonas sp.]
MSQKHKVKIEKLFEHPISGNIDAKKMISALEHYGAKIDLTKQHKAKIFVGKDEFILSLSHRNDLSKDSIVNLRHFLEKVGLTPDKL